MALSRIGLFIVLGFLGCTSGNKNDDTTAIDDSSPIEDTDTDTDTDTDADSDSDTDTDTDADSDSDTDTDTDTDTDADTDTSGDTGTGFDTSGQGGTGLDSSGDTSDSSGDTSDSSGDTSDTSMMGDTSVIDTGVMDTSETSTWLSELILLNYNDVHDVVEVHLKNNSYVGGIQFNFSGADMVDVYDGLLDELSYTIEFSESTFLTFSFAQIPIEPTDSYHHLCTIELDNIVGPLCLLNAVVASSEIIGAPIPVEVNASGENSCLAI